MVKSASAELKRTEFLAKSQRIDDQVYTSEVIDYISGDASWNLQEVILGNPNVEVKNDVKVVRIFTSSTFTDTRHERNALMENVYPKLKDFCQDLGYEFQVVDMRWGVREEALDDHLTVELCMREIELCQRLSTGPNFVTFLSHKYGYRPFPRRIPAEEFTRITERCKAAERDLLKVWFLLDDNAVPAEYVLQRVSSIIPDFVSKDLELKDKAVKKWWKEFDVLQTILIEGAQRVLTKDQARKYIISVTEKELVKGILKNQDCEQNSIWFKRNIRDIEKVAPCKVLSRYYEKEGQSVEMAHRLLEQLRTDSLMKKLTDRNIVEYNVPWSANGIDPEQNKEHKSYIRQMCADFEKRLKYMIQAGIDNRQKAEVNDPLYNEIVQHINFCRAKCELFSGRYAIIELLRDYVLGTSRLPLVLHGASGCGKTSIMAVAARSAWDWLRRSCTLVYRFLGTTRASGSLRSLLFSLTYQISRAYKKEFLPQMTLHDMVEDFKDCLHYATPTRPLVLLLDSLDQLDNTDGGRHLHWLPKELPPNVKLILSTLPEEEYQAYQSCLGLYQKRSCYMSVPQLDENDLSGILNKWLERANRTLTVGQRDLLMDAFRGVPIPLYVKLNFDEALRWHSYDPPSAAGLQETVSKTIHGLLWRIERQHGRLLVSHALGCLTAAQKGLTEGEIEDLLSLSDEVLSDVYQFWTPPIRRLPPLLWVRVKNELQEYLVHRGVDGVQVIYWYHRQFIEVAHERYLNTADERFKYHLALSEFFIGAWSEKPKPYVNMKGKELKEIRFVAKQPNQFENGEYNLRKLMQLPYHLVHARELTVIKTHVLCDYEFLVAKLKATTFGALMRDLKMARAAFPTDQDLQVVTEALQLSQEALTHDGNELASQLVGRIHGTGSASMIDQAAAMLEAGVLPPEAVPILSMLQAFEEQHERRSKHLIKLLDLAHKPLNPTLLPNRGFLEPPGGQLMYQLAGHTDTLTDIDISTDGQFVVTGCEDKTVKLWNIKEGDMRQSVEVKEKVGFVRFISDDQNVLISCAGRKVYLVDIQLGLVQAEYSAPSHSDSDDMVMPIGVCLDPNNREFLVTMRNKEVDVWDVEKGKRVSTNALGMADWGSAHGGHNMRSRSLLTHNQFYCYCLYRGSCYFILSIDDREYAKAVTVFDDYKYDKNSKTPDYAPDDVAHISDLAITGDASMVIACNGANLDLHIHDFESGARLSVIHNKDRASMSHFYLPQNSAWIYFTDGVYIGTWNLTDNKKTLSLRHPCRPTKVVGVKSTVIVTIAEDNILRIWDRSKPCFEQDLSSFTGKVKIKETKDANDIQNQFDAMISGVMGNDAANINTNELLTSEETLNYWTNPDQVKGQSQDSLRLHLKVITRMFLFDNSKYLVTVQDDTGGCYSLCMSVWDLRFGRCMRRMFLPAESVYVHMIYGDSTIVVTEKRKLKLLDLKRFTLIQVLQGLTFDHRPPFVLYVKSTRELITESRGGRYLKIYDPLKGEVTGELIPSTKNLKLYLSSTIHPQVHIHNVQVSADGVTVAALYTTGTPTIYLWNLATRNIIYAVNSRSLFEGLRKERVEFSFSKCGMFMVVLKDASTAKVPSNNDIAIVNTRTGKLCSHVTYPKNEKERVDASNVQTMCLLRQLAKSYVQMIGIDKDGVAKSITYKSAGWNANQHTVTDDQNYVATWCDNPREKTLQFWKYDNQEFEPIGSFTPDNELTVVCVTPDGRQLVIDSSTGIVVLQLMGRNIKKEEPAENKPNKVIYDGIDLKVKYPESPEEELLTDEEDPDKDTDYAPHKK